MPLHGQPFPSYPELSCPPLPPHSTLTSRRPCHAFPFSCAVSTFPARALLCGALGLFSVCWGLVFVHFCLSSSCLTIPATNSPPAELALFTTPSPFPTPVIPTSPLLTPSLSPHTPLSSPLPSLSTPSSSPSLSPFLSPSLSPSLIPSPTHHPSPGLLTVLPFINSSHPSDSTFTLLSIRPRGSHSAPDDVVQICSFTNALVRLDEASGSSMVALRFTSLEQHRWVQARAAECWSGRVEGVESGREHEMCQCFHPQFMFEVAAYEWRRDVGGMGEEEAEQFRVLPHPFRRGAVRTEGDQAAYRSMEFSHAWSVHKWVRRHHIAHWAQKLLMMQTVHQHRSLFAHLLPPIDALIFHDSDADVSAHEQSILNASLTAALDDDFLLTHQLERTVWASAIEQRSRTGVMTPVRRLSFTPHYGILATHSDDTLRFRSAVYRQFGLPPVARCPPLQVTFLYRHDRGVMNRQALVEWIEREFDVSVTVATINETTPSAEQVGLFARTGLMLSSHSSQLMNVLFSQPGSAVIEVSPEYYNTDFASYSHAMGVYFQYALGGEVDPSDPSRDLQPAHADCVAALSVCNGFAHCVLREKEKCSATRHARNKNLDFVANQTAVQTAVRNAMGHLQWLCDGQFTARWRRETRASATGI